MTGLILTLKFLVLFWPRDSLWEKICGRCKSVEGILWFFSVYWYNCTFTHFHDVFPSSIMISAFTNYCDSYEVILHVGEKSTSSLLSIYKKFPWLSILKKMPLRLKKKCGHRVYHCFVRECNERWRALLVNGEEHALNIHNELISMHWLCSIKLLSTHKEYTVGLLRTHVFSTCLNKAVR